MPLLSDNAILDHNISGRYFAYNNIYPCHDCAPNEKRFNLAFRDRDRPYLSNFIIIVRHLNGNPEKLHVGLKITGGLMLEEGQEDNIRVPLGDYLMTKID